MEVKEKSILLILDAGFRSGGAERVASRLVGEWIKSGIKVTVLSLSNSQTSSYVVPSEANCETYGEYKIYHGLVRKVLYQLRLILKLRNHIKNHNSNVIVSFLTVTNIRTLLASLGLRKRIIISERNDISRQELKWLWKFSRNVLYRYADAVTSNTLITLSCLKEMGIKASLKYIHNPVEIPVEMAIPDNSNTILSVGRLIPQKSQATLINAVALIPSHLAWNLEILGEGVEKDRLFDLTRALGIQDYVKLIGFSDEPDDFYKKAAIFVLPSLYEGMPNALLEAMSYGLPCIVSDSLPGALEHVVHGETGLVFHCGDEQDLANNLTLLMENPALRLKLGKAARNKMHQYSPESVTNIWNDLLFTEGVSS